MKKLFLFSIILLCYSCFTGKHKPGSLIKELTEIEIAQRTFSDIDSLLKIDDGKFLDTKLNGALILVNPKTRAFIANENNALNTFKKELTVFTGILPKSINIANTAINWEGKKWSMVMLPLPIDKMSRNNLVIHELYHQFQSDIGFHDINEQNNGHLDTYNGRVLLKLELEALRKALSSEKSSHIHLKNALIFRNLRQNDERKRSAENSLEINEGLAEFTALILSGRSVNEVKLHLTNSIDQFYSNPTFVRSFAYQTIPIYGYLLFRKNSSWHRMISRNTNLTDYFIESFGIDIDSKSSFEQIAKEYEYNYDEILKEEMIREEARLTKVLELKKKFLEEPTLKLNFEKMNISFNPMNITPLEGYGTVYPTLKIIDNWGVLTVKNDALLASNWANVIVTYPTEIGVDITKGDGWTLELNKGWNVIQIGKNFELVKE